MATEFRCDTSPIRGVEMRPDGSMVVPVWLTRTGVFTYNDPATGKQRREYRPPEEVFDAESMASFGLVPVTDEHPPKMLTSRTAKQYARGAVGENIRQDGDHVAARMVISDDALVAKVQAGKRDVSCGYKCEIDPTPGVTPAGVPYDVVQRKIRGNHLAVTSIGRAGSARIRMDGAMVQITDDEDDDMADTRNDAFPPKKKAAAPAPAAAAAASAPDPAAEPPFEDEEADDAEGHPDDAPAPDAVPPAGAPPQPAPAGGSIEARLASALGEIAQLIQELTDAKAGAAAATARADAAEDAMAERMDELVRERVDLIVTATPVLGDQVRIDSLTDREIRVAVIKEVTGVVVGDHKSEDYVAARYDAALERYEAAGMASAKLAEVIALRRDHDAPKTTPSTEKAAAEAREEMIARNRGRAK